MKWAASALAAIAMLLTAGVLMANRLAPDRSSPQEAHALQAADNRMALAMAEPCIAFTGDADTDFATQMVPHHQGAIEMAEVELQYGTDPWARSLAQLIQVAQKPQIDQMNHWKTIHPVLAARPADQTRSAFQKVNQTMMDGMAVPGLGRDPDTDFVRLMIPHHQGAVAMAQVQLALGQNPQLRKLAADIIKDQTAEIAEMKAWLKTRRV